MQVEQAGAGGLHEGVEFLVGGLGAGIYPLEVDDQLERDPLADLADLVTRPNAGKNPPCLGCGQVPLHLDGLREAITTAIEFIFAFRLSDGAELWAAGDSVEGLHADGGVVIGLDGRHRVRVYAPWKYDIVADTRTGATVALHLPEGMDAPSEMAIFPALRPTRYRVASHLHKVVARRADGRVAWRITIATPQFGMHPAVAVPGGLLVLTSSGHLVALDFR